MSPSPKGEITTLPLPAPPRIAPGGAARPRCSYLGGEGRDIGREAAPAQQPRRARSPGRRHWRQAGTTGQQRPRTGEPAWRRLAVEARSERSLEATIVHRSTHAEHLGLLTNHRWWRPQTRHGAATRFCPLTPTNPRQNPLAHRLRHFLAMGNADIALRHLARRRSEDLARVFAPEARTLLVDGWFDTQLTALERRIDKALRLHVDGEPRILHIEFFFEMSANVPDRLFDYLGQIFNALCIEKPRGRVPPIKTIAVLLSGRKKRWPIEGRKRAGWPEPAFTGLHFRIDAVYQRSVAELWARNSLFWLVFVPLARDATAPALQRVVREIGTRVPDDQERRELYAALILMAKIDPWGHNLKEELTAMITDDDREGFEYLRRLPSIGPLIEKAEARAEAKGAEKATETLALELLGGLFARRTGRRPTPEEAQSIVERTKRVGAVKVEDALLDLDRDALLRWLSEPLPAQPKREKKRRTKTPASA
ncbi:MAG: hypothetical protein U0359_14105 [Byssovorax sp.]